MQHQAEKFELYKMLFGMLFSLSTRLETIGTKYLEELTTKQWFLLAVITTFFKEEPPSISQLAETVGLSHQNIKQLALRLEKKGFVKIINDPGDRRVSKIKLTDKINEYSTKHDQSDKRFIEAMFRDISQKEAEQCLSTLNKLGNSLERINIQQIKEEQL